MLIVLDHPEISDGLTKLVALFGVLDRIVHANLGAAHRPHTQLESAHIEYVERDLMPLADLSQQVLDRYLYVVERYLHRRGTLYPQFLFFGTDGQSFVIFLDDETGELLAVHLCENDVQIGETASTGSIRCKYKRHTIGQ